MYRWAAQNAPNGTFTRARKKEARAGRYGWDQRDEWGEFGAGFEPSAIC